MCNVSICCWCNSQVTRNWQVAGFTFTRSTASNLKKLANLLAYCMPYCNLYCMLRLKQASHWHDKRFMPWPTIWRANERRTRNGVRGDAWRCGSAEIVRAMSWLKFWNVQNIFPRCHDLLRRNCQLHMCDNWVSRISWIVRNLCVTDSTTWRKLCVTLPSWQSLCHWNGTTWHAILPDIVGTKFVPVWGLTLPLAITARK